MIGVGRLGSLVRLRRRLAGIGAILVAGSAGTLAGLASAAPSPAITQGAPAAPPGRTGPSPLIYPAETIPIRFDHAAHARLGATCEGCHAAAQTSLTASREARKASG